MYLIKQTRGIEDMSTNLEEYLAEIAIKEALYLPIDTEFKVSELFPKASWIVLSQPDVEFGRVGLRFYQELEKQKLLDYITVLSYKDNTPTVYQRIGKTVEEALRDSL